MPPRIIEITDPAYKSDLCHRVLNDLPQWFGILEANQKYCREVIKYRFFAVFAGEKEVGFAALKKTNAYVTELFVMRLFPKYHAWTLEAY